MIDKYMNRVERYPVTYGHRLSNPRHPGVSEDLAPTHLDRNVSALRPRTSYTWHLSPQRTETFKDESVFRSCMAMDSMDSSDGDSPTIRDGAEQQTFRDQGLEFSELGRYDRGRKYVPETSSR